MNTHGDILRAAALAGRLARAARCLVALALVVPVLVLLPSRLAAQSDAPPSGVAVAAPSAAPLHVQAVAAVAVTVSDLDRSVAFFTDVLDFRTLSVTEAAGPAYERLVGVFGARTRTATLALGDERLQLVDYLTPEGRAVPADSRSNDRWFQHVAIIVSDMDRAYARLRAAGVQEVSAGPQTLPDWNPNAGGIRAFYFHDPDGHALEVLWFPPGKGAARWHASSANGAAPPLFLGIDHTAIVVGDTDASLAFYRDGLGLTVAGASENYGVEQEHLNAVFGARLRITSLRAPAGPGIEFLQYLAPGNGRPAPPDLASNDLAHWHTVLSLGGAGDAGGADPANAGPAADATDLALQSLLDARSPLHRGSLVSPSVQDRTALPQGAGRALLARDPDGHGVELIAGGALD